MTVITQVATMYDFFAIFGMVAFGSLAAAVLGLGFLMAIAAVIRHWPNLHWGAPRNPVEWRCYDRREILTAKGGGPREPTGRGQLIQELRLRWWVGLTGQSGTRWFFGLQRWDNNSSGL